MKNLYLVLTILGAIVLMHFLDFYVPATKGKGKFQTLCVHSAEPFDWFELCFARLFACVGKT